MKNTPAWYARKPYIHFDLPLGPQAAYEYVTDPQKVERHSFYPLLRYKLITPRIRRCPTGSAKPFVKDPKKRPISYPAHKDGYIYSYYKSLLEPRYEDWLRSNELGEAVTAFRRIGENNLTLAKKAFDFIRSNPKCKIVVTDIESFFDNLDHDLLKKTWARFLGDSKLPSDHYAVYKAITRYSYVKRHKAYNLFRVRLSGRLNTRGAPLRLCTPKEFREKVVGRKLIVSGSSEGIPQGTSLSPLLSNMYLAEFDLAIYSWVTSRGGRYWRYCDDVLVVVPDENAPGILRELDSALERLSLTRSIPKTDEYRSTELKSGKQLQYLGLVFNGSDVVVRSSSIHRYKRKVRRSIRMTKGRQVREGRGNTRRAPFRKQALYNMYSDKPVRGKRIRIRTQGRKYRGNFIGYMDRAAKELGSTRVELQRERVLEAFEDKLREE